MKRLSRRPAAILFDMDGVIVDSMPYHFISWYEALRPYGVSVRCFDVYKREGEKWEPALYGLWGREKRPLTKAMVRDIFAAKNAIFKRYFQRAMFPSVPEILSRLKGQGYRLALVTGTTAPEMRKILSKKIRGMFETIVTGDQVRRGKPFPDPYLKAARQMALSARQCLVVENAPYGVRAAKAAGMACVALTTSLPREYLKKADIVLDDLRDLASLLPKK